MFGDLNENNYFGDIEKEVFDALIYDFYDSRIWKWLKGQLEVEIKELQDKSLCAVLTEKNINSHNERVFKKKSLESIIELVNDAKQYSELSENKEM